MTDLTSVARGIGPECIINYKNNCVGQQDIFNLRSSYRYWKQDGALCVIDLVRGKSLTNDMDAVLREIDDTEGGLEEYKIMYRDSYGEWAGVNYKHGQTPQFFGLGHAVTFEAALENLTKRK